MIALLVTLLVYSVPNAYPLGGGPWWVYIGTCSLLYVLLIYLLCESNLKTPLVTIECFCLACVTTAFYQGHFSSGESFVSANIADIIQYCFMAELAVALGGLALGIYHRVFRRRRDVPAGNPTGNRALRTGETSLCPSL
jgi:hypothetical protein